MNKNIRIASSEICLVAYRLLHVVFYTNFFKLFGRIKVSHQRCPNLMMYFIAICWNQGLMRLGLNKGHDWLC